MTEQEAYNELDLKARTAGCTSVNVYYTPIGWSVTIPPAPADVEAAARTYIAALVVTRGREEG